jgi:hypothetical protein
MNMCEINERTGNHTREAESFSHEAEDTKHNQVDILELEKVQ